MQGEPLAPCESVIVIQPFSHTMLSVPTHLVSITLFRCVSTQSKSWRPKIYSAWTHRIFFKIFSREAAHVFKVWVVLTLTQAVVNPPR